MDYIEFFYNRITQLRLEKGVSSRDMSLSLGQSESYINKIENRRTLPSLTGFFFICEYFGITPSEFFNADNCSPTKANELFSQIQKLSPEHSEHVFQIVKDLISIQ
ncbi:MAG: helix-turn-helix transcriptional regulator [Clostridia bacterium]|nr:helix-turn-helix transcriptional regulator [Clostridia bacterium]MBQ8183415.1 helix-turn-helix transcriptional regulator [Clostridia bacterium]